MQVLNVYANLENYIACKLNDGQVNGNITLREEKGCVFVDFDVECEFYPYDYTKVFERYNSLVITVDVGDFKRALAQRMKSPFWAEPVFAADCSGLSDKLQYVLFDYGDLSGFMMAISNDSYCANISGDENGNTISICVNSVCSDITKLYGTAAVIAFCDNPYDAMKKVFNTAYEEGLIKTPAKAYKKYPEALGYLGWCTWDAFYHDVTEEGIINKLEEFKEKNIPVKWILIDDGWAETNGFKLESIYEDRSKFPKGLKATVDLIKKKYGIRWVGIWHSATAYWHGAEFLDETTQMTNSNVIIPKGYDFYKKWHTYLKQQGIDFIKVDCQGNIFEYLKNTQNGLKKVIEIQEGIESSACENFDFMINCMGMNSLNVLNRRSSVLMRSSDDFFPERKDSFKSHLMQNVYNSVFNDNLYYCDFDMWWSEHFQAKQNAVLRAISGGPFYTSDKIGNSDGEIIKLFVDNEGKVDRFDNALKPTMDCLYGFNDALKVFNTCGQKGVVAVFTFEWSACVNISASDFGGNGAYTVTDIFSQESIVLGENEKFNVNLDKNDVKLFVFEKK